MVFGLGACGLPHIYMYSVPGPKHLFNDFHFAQWSTQRSSFFHARTASGANRAKAGRHEKASQGQPGVTAPTTGRANRRSPGRAGGRTRPWTSQRMRPLTKHMRTTMHRRTPPTAVPQHPTSRFRSTSNSWSLCRKTPQHLINWTKTK